MSGQAGGERGRAGRVRAVGSRFGPPSGAWAVRRSESGARLESEAGAFLGEPARGTRAFLPCSEWNRESPARFAGEAADRTERPARQDASTPRQWCPACREPASAEGRFTLRSRFAGANAGSAASERRRSWERRLNGARASWKRSCPARIDPDPWPSCRPLRGRDARSPPYPPISERPAVPGKSGGRRCPAARRSA